MAIVMRASPSQRSRIGLEEGNRLEAYQDTVGVWTIGKGHAATNPIPVRGMLNGEYYEGKPKKGVTITPQEVDRLFELDLNDTERGISELITAPLTQPQFDALVDFVHQYGMDRFRDSTLLDKINFNPNNFGKDESDKGILYEFMRWDKAGGEIQEYVWRRSARRCCIYTGTLIPQKLWRKTSTAEEPTEGYPFAIHNDGGWKVDYSKTPTIYQILADGRRLSKPPEPAVNKSWDDLTPKPNATVTIITDQPAAPVQPDAKGGAAPVPPTPEAAPAPSTPSGGTSSPPSGPAGPVVAPQPSAPPVPSPKPKEPEKPVAPPPLPKDAAPASIEPKDMVLSKRFWGLAITAAGTTNFLPRGVNEWINNEGNRELLTWLAVVAIGIILYKIGQAKATRPLK